MIKDKQLNDFIDMIYNNLPHDENEISVAGDEYKSYIPKEIDAFKWYILKCSTLTVAKKISDSLYGWWICEDKKYYVVGCGLPVNGKLQTMEYDNSEEAKALLKSVYNKENSTDIVIENDDIVVNSFKIEMSSDTDVNFKRVKIRYYEDIIDSNNDRLDENQIKSLKTKVNVLNQLTYTPNNISLMPKTAGLNNIKQNWGNDRIDTFICMLDLYYKGNRAIILDAGRMSRGITYYKYRQKLAHYLDTFSDIYDYCEKIYHIDNVLVDIMLQTGAVGLESAEMIDIYISVAIAFWNQKALFFYNCPSKEVKDNYLAMLNTLSQAHGTESKSKIPKVKNKEEIASDLKEIRYKFEMIKRHQ